MNRFKTTTNPFWEQVEHKYTKLQETNRAKHIYELHTHEFGNTMGIGMLIMVLSMNA